MAKTSGDEAPWDRKRPEGKKTTALTPESRHKAKKRAREAGRKYPNLVDNMWAAAEQRKTGTARKKSAGAKTTGGTKRAGAAKKSAGAKKKRAGARKSSGAKKKAAARKAAK
jgi:hypothetical protein